MASVSCSVSSSDSGPGTGGVVGCHTASPPPPPSRGGGGNQDEELNASRSHSRQKVDYLMEYLGLEYKDVDKNIR